MSPAHFIHRHNIEHYERLLQTVTDETERKRILKLLEEEKKKTISYAPRSRLMAKNDGSPRSAPGS